MLNGARLFVVLIQQIIYSSFGKAVRYFKALPMNSTYFSSTADNYLEKIVVRIFVVNSSQFSFWGTNNDRIQFEYNINQFVAFVAGVEYQGIILKNY